MQSYTVCTLCLQKGTKTDCAMCLLFNHVIAVTLLLILPFPSLQRCLTDVEEVKPKRYFHVGSETLSLTLEVSDRAAHQMMTHIFKIFLQEVLGYPHVTLTYQPDNFVAEEALGRLSDVNTIRDYPKTTINLEVWISADTDISRTGHLENVEDSGLLRPGGRFGWFLPRRLPVRIFHWHELKDPSKAAMLNFSQREWITIKPYLKIDNSSERYHCEASDGCEDGLFIPDICKNNGHSPCAVLLASYPNVTGFVMDHIRNMSVRVIVAWLGPHLLTAVDAITDTLAQIEANKSFIVLTHSPSPLTLDNKYDMIAMPTCENLVSSSGCKYEMYRLMKVLWSKLRLGARQAYESVYRMSYKPDQYDDLIRHYQRAVEAERRPLPDAACAWLRENKDIWEPWVPRNDKAKIILFIGGIFPISGKTYTARGLVHAAQLATEAVNANTTILRDYSLKLLVHNGECKADMVMKSFIDYTRNSLFDRMAGILGPACSDTVEPLAGVARHYKVVVISYSAEGSSFNDRDKYPYFFRTIGENKQYKHVYLKLFKELQWTRVASLAEDGQKYTEYLSHLHDLLQNNGISFIVNRKFPHERDNIKMEQYLKDLKDKRAKIIIGDFYDSTARDVMCEAYRQGMTARDGFVWFLPSWLSTRWYDTDFYNNQTEYGNVTCSTEEMLEAIDGHFSLTHAHYAPDDALIPENTTVKQWREKYEERLSNFSAPKSDYAGYVYDTVWTYALALNELVKINESYLTNMHSDNTTTPYVDIIRKTDFHGVSGHIKFAGGPSRISYLINIVQRSRNKTVVVGAFYLNVTSNGTYNANGGRLVLNPKELVWFTPDGKPPGDGSLPPPRCILREVAELLDVECEVAIVIVNIVGFTVLGVILIIAFLILKRRYDKKYKVTHMYMKSLGIDGSNSSMPGLDKWEIDRDKVVINRKLGEGAFGTVYGGEAHFPDQGWIGVAVKTLKVGSTTEEKLDFLSEAEVMKRFDHQNIVRLIGVCTKKEPVYTVMEFMLYGDLKTYLLARRHLVSEKNGEDSDEVSSKRLTAMALDVARALSYLADLKYVHRDVASRNCLVNFNRVVKLGDFGMTRRIFDSDYYKFNRRGMLPVRWMSPESLGLGIFTPKSDIWSFGVLLYEIITFGNFPFQGLSNTQVLEYVKNGNTLTVPVGVKPQIETLIRTCWEREAKDRPQASQIVEFLANNPRVLSPCLDVPLSSVQDEGTDQPEFKFSEKLRKCSLSLSSRALAPGVGVTSRRRTPSGTSLARNNGASDPSLLENGCVREPLLGGNGIGHMLPLTCNSKFNSLHEKQFGKESDDYCPTDIRHENAQAVTML